MNYYAYCQLTTQTGNNKYLTIAIYSAFVLLFLYKELIFHCSDTRKVQVFYSKSLLYIVIRVHGNRPPKRQL